MPYISFNPATNEQLANYDTISDDELKQKLESAHEQCQIWKNKPFNVRAALLQKVADLLEQDKESYAKTITVEMGKPILQSIAEVEKSALACRYYAENAEAFLQEEPKQASGTKSKIIYNALGVIFAIMPWNFPFWQVFRFAAPNLVAGNGGLLKHASNVPQCALAIESVFLKAGAPEGLFQNLFMNYTQTEMVISHQAVKGVTLTGSEYAGSKVAGLAGKNIKKSVLELGGSDPFIVFEDADVEKAVETAIFARFQNTGQSCIASKRFIVHESVYDTFLEKFIKKVQKLNTGNPLETKNDIGPIARLDLLEEIDYIVKKSVDMGANILCGGKIKTPNTNYYLPTIIDNIPENSPLNTEEVFGPVATLYKFRSEDNAIKLANNTQFGLGASVWTKDMQRAERLAQFIETGTVAINGMVKSDPALPFGGIKQSGYGRELSDIGLKEFLNIKTISFYE